MVDVPQSMPADGTLKVVFVPALTLSAPKLTELSAGVELSCYLTADGWNPATEEATVTDSRLCTKQEFEQPGRVTESLDIKYVWNSLDPDEDEARQTLTRGVVGYLATRWGKDVDLPFVATDEIDIHPVKAGIQKKVMPEANSVHRIDQKAFVTGPVLRDVAIVA